MNKYTFSLLLSFIFLVGQAQNSLIQNVYGRKVFSLNSKWQIMVDPYEQGFYDFFHQEWDTPDGNPRGGFSKDLKPTKKTDRIEYGFTDADRLFVPADWNSQREDLKWYEGSIWYKQNFDYTKKTNKRLFVHFGAANYEAHVYLNGKKLGSHKGGFTPFNFEMPDSTLLEKNNVLTVRVNNERKEEAVPPKIHGWYQYGGITRDVHLVEVNKVFIKDYFIQLKKGSIDEVEGYISIEGSTASQKVELNIPELKIAKTIVVQNKTKFNFKLAKATLWSPENPKRYDILLKLNGTEIQDKIGFRCIEVKGSEIYLNKKKIWLKGICLHEENPIKGARSNSAEEAKMFIASVKDLKCNFLRLAHYPHNEYLIKEAEEKGIILWSEIPVFWVMQWQNPETYSVAESQLEEMIQRDKNRACIAFWSVTNETRDDAPGRNIFIKKLINKTRFLDSTRLVTAATFITGITNVRYDVKDSICANLDVVGFNEYIAWYDDKVPEQVDAVVWGNPYQKPLIVSEFGAEGSYIAGADSATRWSEEFQDRFYKHHLQMIANNGNTLQGCAPWILYDFRYPKALNPNYQNGWNRKGLITEKGMKKKAYFRYRNFKSMP